MRVQYGCVAAVLLACGGCPEEKPAPVPCNTRADCSSGQVCCNGLCQDSCKAQGYCGDGIVQRGEECDPAAAEDGGRCSLRCELCPPGGCADGGLADAATDGGLADAATDGFSLDRAADGGSTDRTDARVDATPPECTRDQDCAFLNDPCSQWTCSGGGGGCVRQAINERGWCDDGLFCTTGERCYDGVCSGGTQYSCAHLDAECVLGVCNEDSDSCEKENLSGDCDDGDACTVGDSCDQGACVSGEHDDTNWDCAEVLSVSPVYSTARYWNRWLVWRDRSRPVYAQQSPDTCTATSQQPGVDCFHGGEVLTAHVTAVTSCEGLEIRDALAAFSWACELGAGGVDLYSTGLAPGMGLRHLVTETGFRDNTLQVSQGERKVARSQGTWGWSNAVQALPSTSAHNPTAISGNWTIYVLGVSATRAGYYIQGAGVSLVTLPGAILQADPLVPNAWCSGFSPATRCLLHPYSTSVVWLEAELKTSESDRPLIQSRNSSGVYVAWLRASGGGVWLGSSKGSWVRDAQVTSAGGVGLRIGPDTSGTLIERSEFLRSAADGALIAGADSALRDVRVEQSGGNGVLVTSSGNRLHGVASHANAGVGVRLAGSDNVLVGARLSNNLGAGLELSAPDAIDDSANLVAVDLLSAFNVAGVLIQPRARGSILSHATLYRNTGAGLAVLDTDDGRLNNLLAVGNEVGVVLGESVENPAKSHRVYDVAAGSSASTNIALVATEVCFVGHLRLDQLSGNCAVSDCTKCTRPGLVDATCTESGADGSSSYGSGSTCSDAVLHTGVAVAAALRGLASSDATTPEGSTAVVRTEIDDWSHFDDDLRVWGPGSGAGPCTAGTCKIWDLRLRANDTALRGVRGTFAAGAACPASASGDEALSPARAGTHTAFVAAAVELLGDGLGDDDGLCESNEGCLFAPSAGADQGDGEVSTTTCSFDAGAVMNVDLYGVP